MHNPIFQLTASLKWFPGGILPFTTKEEGIILEYNQAFGESDGKKESPSKEEEK